MVGPPPNRCQAPLCDSDGACRESHVVSRSLEQAGQSERDEQCAVRGQWKGFICASARNMDADASPEGQLSRRDPARLFFPAIL